MYVLDPFDQAITTLLIGTNILHLTIATIVTVAVQRVWGMWAVTAATLVTTVVVFFAGEMLPKSIAKKYAERLAMATARSLRCFFIPCPCCSPPSATPPPAVSAASPP